MNNNYIMKTFSLGELFLQIDNMQAEIDDIEFEAAQRKLGLEAGGFPDLTVKELEERAEMIKHKMDKLLDLKIKLPFKEPNSTANTTIN